MVIVLNLLSLAAVVVLGSIFSCRIVDVWNSLSDAIVKSTSVAIVLQESPAIADKPARRLRSEWTVYVSAVEL